MGSGLRRWEMRGTLASVFRSRLVAVLIIVAASFLAYWPAQRNGFVWDDTALIMRDPLIRSWRLAPEAFQEFLFLDATASNFYRPVQRLTFIADYALWGFENPGAWHLTSVFWHALAAVALFAWLRLWLGEKAGWIPLVVALIWAVHPMYTSAVGYISGRADSLAALFMFSALALLESDLRSRTSWRTGLAAFCALLALLSKESGAMILVLWGLRLICQPGGLRWKREVWMPYAFSLVVIVGVYSSLRFTADKTPPPVSEVPSLTMRPVLAMRALSEYATLLAIPNRLHMERDIRQPVSEEAVAGLPWAHFRHWQTAFGLALLVALAAWLRWAWKREPQVAFAILGFVATWLPISNFLPLNATVAEHWMYVPGAFLFTAVALSARVFLENRLQLQKIAAACILVWTLGLIAITGRQQSYWSNQETFLQETLTRAGRSPRMLLNAANAKMQRKDFAGARQLLDEALKQSPEMGFAQFSIATLAFMEGHFEEAKTALAVAEKSSVLASGALVLKAKIEFKETGKPPIADLAHAAQLDPRNWSVEKTYITTLIDANKLPRAFTELQRSLALRGYRAEAWLLLGELLERAGQRDAALAAYTKATERDVRDQKSRARLAALQSIQPPTQ